MKNETSIDRSPEAYICPRCGGLIPSNENWGEYPGAISRLPVADEDETGLEICSECGSEEAITQFTGNRLQEPDEFPTMTDRAVERRFGAISIIERHKEKMRRFALRERIEKNHPKD